jgi:GcrA cell cycle regulator
MGFLWSDERVETLRQRWGNGDSATAIAEDFNRDIVDERYQVSRNAIIGKASRMGFVSGNIQRVQPRPRKARALQPRRAQPPKALKLNPAKAQLQADAAIRRVQFAAEAVGTPVAGIPTSLRVTFDDLKGAMCRWPLGDPSSDDFRYRGSPASGGSYCQHHAGLCYRPAGSYRTQRDHRLLSYLR